VLLAADCDGLDLLEQTTTLVDCVGESTPATRVRRPS